MLAYRYPGCHGCNHGMLVGCSSYSSIDSPCSLTMCARSSIVIHPWSPQPTGHRSILTLDWLCLYESRKGKGVKELAVQDVVEASEDSQVQESESESMDERDVE